jgi:hypothetical protein
VSHPDLRAEADSERGHRRAWGPSDADLSSPRYGLVLGEREEKVGAGAFAVDAAFAEQADLHEAHPAIRHNDRGEKVT